VRQRGSALHSLTALVGTGVSSVFLYLIAALNLVILVQIVRVLRDARSGALDEAALERQLDSRGLASRFYGRFTRAVKKPWQMYPLGLLFGLGFDTATEVALLFLAAGAASERLPFYAVLCLPVLFAAGMSLLDTIDGALMSAAYGWASSQPVRKLFYNVTVTALSVAVALIVGTVELLGLLATRLHLRRGFWGWVSQIDMSTLGCVIVALFLLTSVGSLLAWRLGGLERRWRPQLGDGR
jgi:high-affinity nickel-transport protein